MTWKQSVVGLAFGVSMTALVFAAAQAPTVSVAAAQKKVTATKPVVAASSGNGDVIWEQQCSRCHTAPQGFSPRISGTIVRHMRVRASLSRQDEQELLRFLNP